MEVRNRSKGLDLIDRVPDELWNESDGHHQKNLQTTNAGEDVEKREPSLTLLMGM